MLKQGQRPKREDLEEFIREASEVKQLTQHAGWGILERDLTLYQNEIAKKIVYLSPKRPEFLEARLFYLATDKLLSLVNDYQENRDLALGLLQKIENPKLAVTLDVDNETRSESSPDGY